MVTLQEVKQYLRIDFEDDDTLLLSLISTAKQLVMDVGSLKNNLHPMKKKKGIAKQAMVRWLKKYLTEVIRRNQLLHL